MGEQRFEMVAGLEVHAELATRSKVFCGCSTKVGGPPNSQTCPICLGLPGVLPVLNRRAIEYCLRVALALKCEVVNPILFERKNYYYPDLPKNYQISQKRAPLGRNGSLDILVDGQTRAVRIDDVHLEEDTGKLLHLEGSDESLVDYNRSGVPLLELVSAPDLYSLGEVEAYMNSVRSVLLYLGVSECRMEHGQLRFEANISLRPAGSKELGPRVEIKNLNSFRSVVRALEYELKRQTSLLRRGQQPARETLLWDEERGVTEAMRSKEEAQDYRYFPEPDLVPVVIDDDWQERVVADLPELPNARRLRFVSQYGLPDYDAAILTADKGLGDMFEEAVSLGAEAKAASNWLMGEGLRLAKSLGKGLHESGVTAQGLVELIGLVQQGTLSPPLAKQVFEEMFTTGSSAKQIVEQGRLSQVSDEEELLPVIESVIAENADAVANLRAGKKQSFTFLVGQVMRATKGKANPHEVNRLLKERLELSD